MLNTSVLPYIVNSQIFAKQLMFVYRVIGDITRFTPEQVLYK